MIIIRILVVFFSIIWFLITLRMDPPKKQKVFVGVVSGLLVFFFVGIPIIRALTAEKIEPIVPQQEFADTVGIPQFYKSLSIWVGMRPLVYNNVDFSSPRLLQPFKNLDEAINYPIIIQIDDSGQLLVSCFIRSLNGRVSGEIIDNEFVDNPGDYFDRNYSKSTVEVVGQDGIPVLQISFDTDDVMEIFGVFYFEKEGKNMLAFLGDGAHIVGEYKVAQERVKELSVTRIFEYPSKEKFGVLNPNRPIRTKEM